MNALLSKISADEIGIEVEWHIMKWLSVSNNLFEFIASDAIR